MSGHFEALSFDGDWRPYQRAALAAFEKDRKHSRRRTHIVRSMSVANALDRMRRPYTAARR